MQHQSNNVLVISRRAEQRKQLRLILSELLAELNFSSANAFANAGLYFNSHTPLSLVFVSSEFSEIEIAQFIESVKTSYTGAQSVFVLLMPKEQYQTDLLAKYMAIGMHGFLCEPCSIEDVRDVLEVSGRMKTQNSEDRLKAVSGIMLHELMNSASEGLSVSSSETAKNLNRCRERYREVTGESISTAVVSMLRHLPPSKRGSGYERVRKRVQELFYSKVLG